MAAGHFRNRIREPATLACQVRGGISQAGWCRGSRAARAEPIPSPARDGWGRGEGVSGCSSPGFGGGVGLTRGPASCQWGDGGGGGGLRGRLGAGQAGKGHQGPHRGPRAVGRASPPSAGSAGPFRGCRRSRPPGRSPHISPLHPGSPPWFMPSSVSSGSAARGAEAAAAEEARPARVGACGGERGGAQRPRRRQRQRPGGLAAPPLHGGLPAPRGPLRREPHLPGLGVQADWAVRAQSRGSEPRNPSAREGDTSPATRWGVAPRRGPASRIGPTVPRPPLAARSPPSRPLG